MLLVSGLTCYLLFVLQLRVACMVEFMDWLLRTSIVKLVER